MFFNNSNDDPYGDLRKREEYERQQNANFARGIGHFLYRYIIYSFIWLSLSVLIGMSLTEFFGVNQLLATLIGMISSLFVFKVPFTKQYPIKSLMTVWFVFGLIIVAIS